MIKSKKVVLVGCGAVGTSFVYSAINQGVAEDYVLIDVFKDLAEGNELDLHDMQAVVPHYFHSVKAGDYKDCKDADVIVITAGRPQKPGETRLEMVADNAKIMKSIALEIKNSGFSGVTVIASNPVDVLTNVYRVVTGFAPNSIISSGTTLDSSRLKRLISEKFDVNTKEVNTVLAGEHGDSSVALWSRAAIMGKPLKQYIEEGKISQDELDKLKDEAVHMAYKIIEKKRATFYGIGACLCRIVKAILKNENKVLMVGAYLQGEYGISDTYVSVPCSLGTTGITNILEWELTQDELENLKKSADTIKNTFKAAEEAIK
ncbi:L-lactate dehydrogenase [Spiroplasma turonicum]|uniref:L-lactate dehydrogenase n=1 Tax=Spiroplasma turonicum TaxID=216946 RepID=A0A0K1P5C1_9MOLU|nr:L-lactate dehydrogenase [Spiroplasma turonicum]AKU79379.1 L-lactate dehydrogenase [Spiroplasma turonicum]ALX70401.1 L-lactate dehydrogenase [Spiroplasma turonicum]